MQTDMNTHYLEVTNDSKQFYQYSYNQLIIIFVSYFVI